MEETSKSYWIGVISKAHAHFGVKGGFIQLNHGKKAPLRRMNAEDRIIIYSPRESYPDGDVLRYFTAIGRIMTGHIYQVEMTPDFKPYRLDVEYVKCRATPIKALIHGLSFIKNKTKWGAPFRFGHLKIPAEDFKIIAEAMGANEAFKAIPL
jgi:predicted RNA-binding protein